jgi:hypothetical protein
MAEKQKILDCLSTDGKFLVVIGKTTVSIECRGDRPGYNIVVLEAEIEPRRWLYRTKRVAIERFEEQVLHYRNRRSKR